MSAPPVGEVLNPLDVPPVSELLTIASDLIGWVDGRVTTVNVGHHTVSVWVTCQADAEHLARVLRLGTVTDYPGEGGAGPFTVWSADGWPGPVYKVFCSAAVARPVRAFPVVVGPPPDGAVKRWAVVG